MADRVKIVNTGKWRYEPKRIKAFLEDLIALYDKHGYYLEASRDYDRNNPNGANILVVDSALMETTGFVFFPEQYFGPQRGHIELRDLSRNLYLPIREDLEDED